MNVGTTTLKAKELADLMQRRKEDILMLRRPDGKAARPEFTNRVQAVVSRCRWEKGGAC